MTLGELIERASILETLQHSFRQANLTEAAEACEPSIITLNEQIEAKWPVSAS